MYAKLIVRNVKRSAKDYLIYMVTLIVCVTLFYAFLSISSAYYRPDIGEEYNIAMLEEGMKWAVPAVTLLLLFLIRYVNNYMLLHRQKEFAVQTVMGMEQRTTAWLFFAETFVLGAAAVGVGILLGMICSQFITAMLLSAYGQSYRLTWMLFPDTAAWTIAFFALGFCVVGLSQVRAIRKIKVIDMLYADKYNEESIRKSRWISVVAVLYAVLSFLRCLSGVIQKNAYYDSRYVFPVKVMFWGNLLAPAIVILLSLVWAVCKRIRRQADRNRWIAALMAASVLNGIFAASVPQMRMKYMLSYDEGTMRQYLLYLLMDLAFFICGLMYLAGSFIVAWKESSPAHKYKGHNLFFFGQIISKLNMTSKTMTLICLTLVLSIFLFMAAPALTEWASGYLKQRSMYDIQINTYYNQVYEEADLPADDYELITQFLAENEIKTTYDIIFPLYLPEHEDFNRRIKYDFPVAAIALSDYNVLREMNGYEPVALKDSEYTTQWRTVATQEERDDFLKQHADISTDHGTLHLAEQSYHEEPIGQTMYNLYTDVLYVFPDESCEGLLAVMRDRYIQTEHTLSYAQAIVLEEEFVTKYPETGEGVHYYIRTSVRQINETKAGNFILQAMMTYGAVVLMIICLTILSLQQLTNVVHYKYRFSVLRHLGVEEKDIGHLVLKQLAVWFGLPIITAVIFSAIIIAYFFQMISAQISAYIGFRTLLGQVGGILVILFGLLCCYFVSTWILFRRAVGMSLN